MADSPHLSAPEWVGGQDNPHTPVNDSVIQLDNAQNNAIAIATADANVTLTSAQQTESAFLTFTGAMTAERDVTLLASVDRRLALENATTGGFGLRVKYAAAGDTVTLAPGERAFIHAESPDVARIGEGEILVSGQTTNATPLVLWDLALASGETAIVEAIVSAKKSTNDEAYNAHLVNGGMNIAGTTTVGTLTRTEYQFGSPDAGLDADLVAETSVNETIDLAVTGATSETWDWLAKIRVIRQ